MATPITVFQIVHATTRQPLTMLSYPTFDSAKDIAQALTNATGTPCAILKIEEVHKTMTLASVTRPALIT